MLVLDTSPLVDFFKAEENAESIGRIILGMEEGKEDVGISTVTISELFYILARHGGKEFAGACIGSIKAQLIVLSVTDKIAEKAGELKFEYGGKEPRKGLPLADCIIAATALETSAPLVTNDAHFNKIKGLRTRRG